MNIYRITLAILILIFLNSCKENWEKSLDKIDKSLLYKNNLHEWRLVQEINSKWDTNYTIEKNDSDTLKLLFYSVRTKDGSIEVDNYKLKYPCHGTDTCYLDMSSQDTLFFYSKNGAGEKSFILGEYAYRFTYFEMDSAEANFYLEHTDSLRRVKGDNLPKLSKELGNFN
jgi:hypothetical protein